MASLQNLIMGAALTALMIPAVASAHCDTYTGPVVQTAKIALEKGDVTPVLKWVQKGDEAEIKAAFAQTLNVRAKGAEAKELADHYFFETLVRIHRSGEGAPYDGLKNAPAEPIVLMLDKALETGSVDTLSGKVSAELDKAIRERFKKVAKARKNAEKSVAAGREYVEAYVDYMHFVEGIHNAISASGKHHEEAAAKNPHEHK